MRRRNDSLRHGLTGRVSAGRSLTVAALITAIGTDTSDQRRNVDRLVCDVRRH